MMNNRKTSTEALLLFLIGLFTETRINLGGSIAIAEVVMAAVAPFVIFKEWPQMRRYGVSTILVLAFLWACGAAVSDLCNHTYIKYAMKGVATPIVFVTSMTCIFALLRRNVFNFKWLLLGFAISSVLATFVFSRASSLEVEEIASNAFDRTVGYKLYWLIMASNFILLPVRGWFMSIPAAYSILATFGMAIAELLGGARSMFVASVVSAFFFILARKSKNSLRGIAKNFVLIGISLMCVLMLSKSLYKAAVRRGWMGDEELQKYERQTRKGGGVLTLLMAGRVEFFVGGYAALQRPFVGRGSWALDYEGIYQDFLGKYGDEEDYNRFITRRSFQLGLLGLIPFHSHIITYWMWHGIFGLLFFMYVGWLTFLTLRKNLHVIPELFGYFILTIPSFLWDLFFSPVGARIQESAMYILFLLVRHYAKEQR